MAFQRRVLRDRTQVIDWMNSGATTIAVSALSQGILVNGAVWPLLAHQSMRIFNVGCQVVPFDSDLKLNCTAIAIFLEVFADAEGQVPLQDKFGAQVSLMLASFDVGGSGMQAGGFVGMACQSEGDPLIEIAANILVAGIAQTPGSVQVSIQADLINTDSATHVVGIAGSALLDFQL